MSHKEIDWSKQRIGFIIATIILFLTGTYYYFNVQRSDSDLKPVDLERLDSLIIFESPKFKETKGKNARSWIEFKCIGYEKKFEIGYFDYSCVNDSEILNDLKIGSIISVALLKVDMPGRRHETFTSKANDIHSLIYKGKEYLNIDCRNRIAKEDNTFSYYLSFIMLPFMLVISLFKNKPKILGYSFEPILIICIIGVIVILILRHDVF